MKAIRLSPFIKDVLLTAVTCILTTVSIIIATRLLAQGLGSEGFGAYSLARRFLALVSPFSTLAMGGVLARYIAISKDDNCRYHYVLGALFLGLTPAVTILIGGLLFADKLTIIVFHSRQYLHLLVATLLLVVGHSFYIILYGLYRGLGKMSKANFWQLGVMALSPIVIALAYAQSGRIDLIILLIAGASSTAIVPLMFYIFKTRSQSVHLTKLKYHLGELIRYGLPRVPGGLALAGILSIGPLLAPYFGSLKDAGYLVIGLSTFSIVESGIFAFGIVALPKVAQLFAAGQNEFLKDRVTDIIALVFHLGLFTTLHLLLWSNEMILIWLGTGYMDALPLMRAFLLALIPYLTYVMLRSIIDAIEERAVNTHNLYLSFGITLVISLVLASAGLGPLGFAIGTTTGLLSLGCLTVLYLWKVYKFNSDTFKIKECLMLNAVFIVVAFIFKYRLVFVFKAIPLMGIALLVEGVLLSLYCLILWKLKVRWIGQLESRIFAVAFNE